MDSSGVQIVVWLAVGVGLVAAEIAMPGFILFPFGVGAFAGAATGWAGGNLIVQVLVFVVVSVTGVVLLRPLGRRLNQVGDQSDIGAGRLIDKHGVVTVAIDDDFGMVKTQGEDWRAESLDGSPIAKGATVRIVALRGTRVAVELVNNVIHEES